ncbi:MAG: hypothetical protein ACXW02_04480 [Halobacteriota archaeon]
MHNEDKKAEHQRVLVKGYMRPDGTSYYVVIPKKNQGTVQSERWRVLFDEGKT